MELQAFLELIYKFSAKWLAFATPPPPPPKKKTKKHIALGEFVSFQRFNNLWNQPSS